MGVITFQIKGSYTGIPVAATITYGVITLQIKGSYTRLQVLSVHELGVITFQIKGSYTYFFTLSINVRKERKVWAASKGKNKHKGTRRPHSII